MQQPFNLKDRKVVSGTGLWPDDTEEMPAIPKESSFGGTYGWQNSLPQIPKPDYPPYWDRPQRQPLDIEKLTGRACIIGTAVVTFAFGLAVLVIFAIKLVQFSMTVTLK